MTRQRADGDGFTGASTKERIKDMADGAAEAVADKAQDIASKVTDKTKEYLDLAQVYGEKAQDAAQQLQSYVEKSLKEQPMATLATAVAVGFLLGALWKK